MLKNVSIIIPAYNSQKTIYKCINTIKKNNKNLSKEIIVVNDGSTDSTLKILYKIKNIKIINFKINRGAGYARQYGAKIAKNDLLCYIDSDIFVSKNSIKKLITKFISKKNVGSVGAIQKAVNLNKKNWTSNFVCLKSCYGFEKVKKEIEFSVVHSEFSLISKKFLFSIGGWKYYKGAGGEEFELGYRILKSNKKIILIKNANYITYYHNIFDRFKEIIIRTNNYIGLFLIKKKFDTKGSFATTNQALSSFITGLIILIVASILLLSSYFLFIKFLIILLLIQIILEFSFLKYSYKIFGFKITLFSLVGIHVINLGIILGAIKFVVEKFFIKKN